MLDGELDGDLDGNLVRAGRVFLALALPSAGNNSSRSSSNDSSRDDWSLSAGARRTLLVTGRTPLVAGQLLQTSSARCTSDGLLRCNRRALEPVAARRARAGRPRHRPAYDRVDPVVVPPVDRRGRPALLGDPRDLPVGGLDGVRRRPGVRVAVAADAAAAVLVREALRRLSENPPRDRGLGPPEHQCRLLHAPLGLVRAVHPLELGDESPHTLRRHPDVVRDVRRARRVRPGTPDGRTPRPLLEVRIPPAEPVADLVSV
mmetsp:Transcript_5842/g.13359  ORF Transcript_5842/g.13359 Transcript_5842/m.13359 type:complete len:260 (-) Transcript_5842:5-784(-)